MQNLIKFCRERRRYTDLVREDPIIAKSVDTVNESLLEAHQGAFRRVQENIGTKESAETGVNENEKASRTINGNGKTS